MGHHRFITIAAMLIAGLPSSAKAQATATISLVRDEAVDFQIDNGGAIAIARGQAGPLSDFERAALDLTLDTDPNMTSGANAIDVEAGQTHLPDPPPVAPDRIKIRFIAVGNGGHQSLLVLENGYGRGFVYRARITVHGRSQATDVCLVQPARRGSEYWPYIIERIELSGFRLEPWDESSAAHCE
jgi:hypothetical protein